MCVSLLILQISLAIATMGLAAPAGAPASRPNIVFAFADDWGRYASAYAKIEPGGPGDIIRTPNFDRISREGVLFTHAFVNAPSCTPCRSSLLSGQYFWRTGRGAILQGAIWDETIPSYPLILRDAGYHIGHTYKVWSPGTPINAPYGGADYAYTARGVRFNQFSQNVSGKPDIAAAKKDLLEEVRGNFRDFLEKRGSRPICYWWGPTNTHRKWIQGSGKEIWGLNPDDLKGKMPAFLPDVPTIREDMADYLGEAQAVDAGLGVLIEELERIGELDNTLLVVSGDHGIPGFPRGKCNLYNLGVEVALGIRWPGHIPGGRVVDDFVNLPDLAPTFLEAAGIKPPAVMTGRSLMPVLESNKNGQIDPTRDFVVVGRERHVAAARAGMLPYPQRAIRTRDFLYIRNFKSDRWPMGDGPGYGRPADAMPAFEKLRENTFVAFGDMDASPTKAWIATHRTDPGMDRFFDYAFGLRPEEELYDLRKDPHYMQNLAKEPGLAAVRRGLSQRLMQVLRDSGDPRATGDGSTYDKPPFAGPIPEEAAKR